MSIIGLTHNYASTYGSGLYGAQAYSGSTSQRRSTGTKNTQIAQVSQSTQALPPSIHSINAGLRAAGVGSVSLLLLVATFIFITRTKSPNL